MKANELIDLLSGLNPETEIFFLPSNSYYAEEIKGVKENVSLRSFWGKSESRVTLLTSGGQEGGVDF